MSDTLDKLDLPPIDQTAGSNCPSRPGKECDVEDWVYATDAAFPRMYGRCERCGARYCFVLPRQAGYRNTMLDQVVRGRFLSEERTDEIVYNATEVVLRGSGNAQRLWFMLTSHPITITRNIVRDIHKMVRDGVRERIEPREKLLTDLTNAVSDRLRQLEDDRYKLTHRGLSAAAKSVSEKLNAIRETIRKEQTELARLRTEKVPIIKEIAAAREAAHREPLPMPVGYAPPPIGKAVVLCAAMEPAELIYGLIDPLDPELVRYVGRTYDAVHRYRQHCTTGADAVSAWVESLREVGRAPAMVLIERCESDAIVARESHWIHHYRNRFQADLNRSIPRRAV